MKKKQEKLAGFKKKSYICTEFVSPWVVNKEKYVDN